MKTILSLLVAALFALSAIPAEAGWNIRQNDDGTTEWVREAGEGPTEITHDVGQVHLTVFISDVSSAATYGVVSPITNAAVSYIQSVVLGNIATADAVFDFTVFNASGSPSLGATITGGGTGVLTITQSGDETGVVDTMTPSANHEIEKNQSIMIHSRGASTGNVPAMFTITLVPRS